LFFVEQRRSPFVHIITYDFGGTIEATRQPKPHRTSGLVTHTHQLLAGLSRAAPRLRLALTQTGATSTGAYPLRTTAGQLALAQGVDTRFADFLSTPGRAGKDPERVRHFYEDRIHDSTNPVYRSLARQYAHVIRVAGTPDVLAQNINAIVSCLKAEELGELPATGVGQLNLTGVLHDISGAPCRFEYLAARLAHTAHRVRLIAVSTAVRDALLRVGIAADIVRTVSNGLDVAAFDRRIEAARAAETFQAVRARNDLPDTGALILLSARRVEWKGHLDVIEAVKILTARGVDNFCVAINGRHLVDSRATDYEYILARRITAAGLDDRVRLLDELSAEEVAACYDAADMVVHPSRHPEAWGYANIEAMLAGTAVIAAGHGGPLDYITHGESGLLVRPCDPPGIADALHRLLRDPDERTRLAHRGQQVATEFTDEAMATAYLHVMRERATVTSGSRR
jgi:glycosyltransferase involved in cell wall biosynthesis